MTKHILIVTLLILFCNSSAWGEALQNQQELQYPGRISTGTTKAQSPTRISSSTVNADTTIIEDARYTLRTTVTRVESPSLSMTPFPGVVPTQYIEGSFRNVSGPFSYSIGGKYYMFFPGTVFWSGNQPTSKDEIDPSPSYILKRTNGFWQFWKDVPEVLMWGPRNYKVTEDWVVIGDGNEIGPDGSDWNGDTYYGEFLSNGDIDWTLVNSLENRAYFHGSTGGDLNGDGLIDVGGAPGWPNALKLFTQNSDGTFTSNDSLINWPNFIGYPFALDFADIMGDERVEIITADYGENNEAKQNHVSVFAYDENTGKYELHFVSEEPRAFYDIDMAATSIQTFDFTGDGILDLAVARETYFGSNSFEIWKGNGDGTFNALWSTPIWSDEEMQFREFWVFDVNGDEALDIVLRPFHYGSLYRNEPRMWNGYNVGNGIKLNHLIWLNNGDETFSHYDKKELLVEGILVDNVHPYMDGENLHFMGTFTKGEGYLWDEKATNLITHDIELTLKFGEIDAISQISPSNNSVGQFNPTALQWKGDPDAEAYILQVSSDGFDTFVINEEVSDTSFLLTNLDYNASYSWRVRGTNSSTDGQWSDVWTFTTNETNPHIEIIDNDNPRLPNHSRINNTTYQVRKDLFFEGRSLYNDFVYGEVVKFEGCPPDFINGGMPSMCEKHWTMMNSLSSAFLDYNLDGKIDLFIQLADLSYSKWLQDYYASGEDGYNPWNGAYPFINVLVSDWRGEADVQYYQTDTYMENRVYNHDLDGDGRDEVYYLPLTGHGGTIPELYGEHDNLHIVYFNDDGIDRVEQVEYKSQMESIASGDIDNDGDIDLVFSEFRYGNNPDRPSHYDPNQLMFYVNDGQGNFDVRTDNFLEADYFYETRNWMSFTQTNLYDIDNDGCLDLTMGWDDERGQFAAQDFDYKDELNHFIILWGDCTGQYTFERVTTLDFLDNEGFVWMGAQDMNFFDYDSDGKTDILIKYTCGWVCNAVDIYRNTGKRTFTRVTETVFPEYISASVEDRPSEVNTIDFDDTGQFFGTTIYDMDGDGDYDIVPRHFAGGGHFPSQPSETQKHQNGYFQSNVNDWASGYEFFEYKNSSFNLRQLRFTPISTERGTFYINGPTYLRWTPVKRGLSYEIKVSKDIDFHPDSSIVMRTDTNRVEFPHQYSHNERYYWKVRATNSDESRDNQWSDTWEFTTNLALPEQVQLVGVDPGVNDSVSQTPKLVWNSEENTTKYQVQISLNTGTDEFGDPVVDSIVEDTAYITPPLRLNAGYTWRVRALNPAGNGIWSDKYGFMPEYVSVPIQKISLLSPVDSSYVRIDTMVTWADDPSAVNYEIHFSNDGFIDHLIATESPGWTTFPDTSFILKDEDSSLFEEGTTYSWKVRGRNGTPIDGEWSDVWTFTILGQPLSPSTPEVPRDGQDNVGTLTEFHWSDVDSARGYQLQVSTDSTFTTQMIQSAELDSSTYTLSEPIRENTQYFWRVRALAEVEALHSEWSDMLSFTTGVRTSVEEVTLPTSYSLNQNYPNPFNPTTSITYSSPQSAVVSLKIYDITGKYITTLVDGVTSAGIHTVTFDAGSLSSGMYVYTLETDGYRQSRQMMLVK